MENAKLLDCSMEQRRMVVALQFSKSPVADRFQRDLKTLKICPFTIDYMTLAEHAVIVMVLSGSIPEDMTDCKSFLQAFLIRVDQFYFMENCKIAVSMGTVCNCLDEIRDSYKVAIALLRIGLIVAPQESIY